MTSTSTERAGGRVLRGLPPQATTPAGTAGDLRTGTWTRLGTGTVLGDAVTEAALGSVAEAARAAGHAQGYAAGWAEGRRRVALASQDAASSAAATLAEDRRELATRQAGLLEALAAAAEQVRGSVAARHDELAEGALHLALQIAEAVVGHELAVAAAPGRDALARALRAVERPGEVVVRLHPEDLAELDGAAPAGRSVTLVPDAGLRRGDAVAETEDGLVDATVDGALARVREVLGC